MTVAPERQPLFFEGVDEVLDALRRAGHRVTLSTRVVLESLFAADAPVSAEQIAARAPAPLEATTVYRTLERLEQLGAVRHVHAGHGPGLYTLASAGVREPEYLACERCGSFTAVDPALLDGVRAELREQFGFHGRFTHFPIAGLCARCAAELGAMNDHAHSHAHVHEHSHGDDVTHVHAHTGHNHEHVEHEHAHRHGDVEHAHPHVHEPGLEADHTHKHG